MKRFLCLLTVWLAHAIRGDAAAAAEDVDFFETRIRPVLVKHCYECHSSGAAEAKGGLLVDFRAGIRTGGESGPGVVPGQPDASLLLAALRHESFEMPPKGKLSDSVIADFEKWIRAGAVDPRERAPTPSEAAALAWRVQLAERSRWWSLQPPKDVSPPPATTITDDAWSREPVDRFVHTALHQADLSPARPVDAATLLRRLSFVLTGLPLVWQETGGRLQDARTGIEIDASFRISPAEYERIVDELLASPHFGERFAHHWMDVVRYTDTYGYEWDNPAKGSWEYRDYLIRAFNLDVGFDQLIREQVAGDLLPEPRINDQAEVNESLIGPMFYHLGEHRHGTSLNFNGIHQDMINNKVDAFSKAFLAMTVACARCHDHKLDAISQADYYALAGVFMSPRWTSRVIDAPGKHDAEIAELKKLREEIRQQLASLWSSGVAPSALRKWAADHQADLKETKIEDIAHPLGRLAAATDETIGDVWSDLSDQWRSTRTARLKANAEKFTVLSDFREPGLPAGWITEGDGIAHGYVDHGTPLVSLAGETLIDQLLPRGYHTHALSSKLPGAVRLPAQTEIPGRFASLRLRGSEWAGYLVVAQNAFQTEAVTFLAPNNATRAWVSIADDGLKNGVTRVLTEVATSSLNPNFPPRTGLAKANKIKLPDDDPGFDKRSWFSLTGIVTHDAGGMPADTLDAFTPLIADSGERPDALDQPGDASAHPAAATAVPATVDEAWQRIAAWNAGALRRWAADEATATDVTLLNWLLEQQLLANQAGDAPAVASLVVRYRELEARIAFPRSANSMDERGVVPVDYRLNVRGDVDKDAAAIRRNFLTVFADQHGVDRSRGSGRLELVKYLSGRDNPQTARVYVNRVWQWVFGRGIVATPSDFGKLGERPSHPELLDWLATQFMAEGWSTKKLIRRLVLSETFRQSATIADAASERDPDNRLLHHYPTRRLEAEAIRDNLLAVSGRLDASRFGRPINPPRTVEDAAKRLFSGPPDGRGRRSIYLQMSIMDPPKFLVCFNLPDLKLPTGRRDVTNVPAQALALLNDPLVVQLSDFWAERLMTDGRTQPGDRVRAMFFQALGRPPTVDELRRWTDAASSFALSDDVMTDQTAWSELAHVFFNTKEFIYYR